MTARLHSLEVAAQASEAQAQWLGEACARQERLRPIQGMLSSLTVPGTGEAVRLAQAFDAAVAGDQQFSPRTPYRRCTDAVDVASAGWEPIAGLVQQARMLRSLVCALAKHVDRPVEPLTAVIERAEEGFEVAKSLENGIMLLVGQRDSLEAEAAVQQRLLAVEGDIESLTAQQDEIRDKIRESQKTVCPRCGFRFEASHTCEVIDANPA